MLKCTRRKRNLPIHIRDLENFVLPPTTISDPAGVATKMGTIISSQLSLHSMALDGGRDGMLHNVGVPTWIHIGNECRRHGRIIGDNSC